MLSIWATVFSDEHADVEKYNHRVFLTDKRAELQGSNVGFCRQGNLIQLGTSDNLKVGQVQSRAETFLQVRCRRYQDVDIKVKLQIRSSANQNPTHWFGMTCRALRPHHWNAYLFYVRQDGDVEFGMMGQIDVKPRMAPDIASQPVTVRMKAEGNRVQTWVNERACHDWVDKEREFVRKGGLEGLGA